jgi:wyosine [tRNA(Phe)-imidazoG37] synthetase (radical SAM superfamily)
MLGLARALDGELTTETMLVGGVNDDMREISKIANFLSELKPDKAYLAIPIRPPAELISTVSESTINAAYQIFSERLNNIEYLIGYEGNAFASTGNAAEDLLSITAVHPMREEAVAELLNKLGTDWGAIQELIDKGSLIESYYQGKKFYTRKLAGTSTG